MRQTAAAHSQFLAGLSARGNSDVQTAVESRDGNLAAQHGFPRREFGFINQIVIGYLEIRVFGQAHSQIKIPSGPPSNPGLTASGDLKPLSLCNAGRNFYLVSLRPGHLASPAANVANLSPALASAAAMFARNTMPY